jgi:hypothetical protein
MGRQVVARRAVAAALVVPPIEFGNVRAAGSIRTRHQWLIG